MVTMATRRTTTTTRRIGLTLTFMAALAYIVDGAAGSFLQRASHPTVPD